MINTTTPCRLDVISILSTAEYNNTAHKCFSEKELTTDDMEPVSSA